MSYVIIGYCDFDQEYHLENTVIATGGGIVENAICRDILKSIKSHVIFVHRDSEDIVESMKSKL